MRPIGSDGTIYGPNALGFTIVARDPTDGSLLWEYYPHDWAVGAENVEIGPDDTLYFVGSTAKLEALNTSNQSRIWQVFDPGTCLNRPTLSPDGELLVLAGSECGLYGSPGFIKGIRASNGHERWRVDLPFQTDPSYRIYGNHHPRITPDGITAYISTYSLIEWPLAADHTFLYALDISPSGCAAPEVHGVRHDPDETTMRWNSHGTGATYDVARGDLTDLGGNGNSSSCIASDISDDWYSDGDIPGEGDVWFYLVRSRTTCGTSPWGSGTGGQSRNVHCP